MSSYCKIHLQYPDRVFTAGSVVEGKVHCYFRNEKNTRGIRLKLKGKEDTHWTEQESYYDSSAKRTKHRTVHYYGENKFLFNQLNLEGEGTISAGHHEYPFSFLLPIQIPGSFQNQYGGITYKLKANVDLPWKTDYISEVIFPVQHQRIDFRNMSPDLQKPIQWSDEKTICCLFCQSGPISFEMYLDREAFVPGEIMRARIDCVNMSNTNVSGIEVEVQMTIESKTTTPRTKTKEDTEQVVRCSDTGVGAHGERTYELDLEIPINLPVYNFERSELFSQYFDIKATCEIDGCHTNMDVGGNIKFGHIPYGPPPALAPPIVSQPLGSSIGIAVNPFAEMQMPESAVNEDGFEVVNGHPMPMPMPMPITMPMPMPMPMPKPEDYPPSSLGGPSAPSELSTPNAPSAPVIDENPNANSPMLPPSYDQAIKSPFMSAPYPPK